MSGLPAEVLKTYQVTQKPLYVIGAFDTGVTVLSQQNRALNFVWAAVESRLLHTGRKSDASDKEPLSVAVVGCGFAGLTLAAGLVRKGVRARITIFEQRDTLLPLQHGSDSRWLHPRIYDWPGEGSEASVAMLPVLNWSAARASDVVVQILAEWKRVLKDAGIDHLTGEPEGESNPCSVSLYCNCRHLQIHQIPGDCQKLHIEWVGDRRAPADGRTTNGSTSSSSGRTEAFDIVVLATGFGIERDGATSYWRNETIGQPTLNQSRQPYLISGQGDGAIIDLLRLCISQYRQDRILDELFADREKILAAIKTLHAEHAARDMRSGSSKSLFASLEELESARDTSADFSDVMSDLSRRLRMDTTVVLHLLVRKVSELFEPEVTRISFQNKIILYFLYKCGGFIPSSAKEEELVVQHSIKPERVIRRHGTARDEMLESVLSKPLYDAISKQRGKAIPDPFSQSGKELWLGGYFGYPGRAIDALNIIDDKSKITWRQEYLPAVTELMATAFCASVAGLLLSKTHDSKRLRVTLHRSITVGGVELLQQACDYQGTNDAREQRSTAARTFPAKNGTIGLAYRCQKVVRSSRGMASDRILRAMNSLALNEASRAMSSEVCFVMAIPLLEPEDAYTAPSPVIGVLYIDSKDTDFFVEDEVLSVILSMANHFLWGMENSKVRPDGRIRNLMLDPSTSKKIIGEVLPDTLAGVLTLVDARPPQSSQPFQINFDYSDFVPVRHHLK